SEHAEPQQPRRSAQAGRAAARGRYGTDEPRGPRRLDRRRDREAPRRVSAIARERGCKRQAVIHEAQVLVKKESGAAPIGYRAALRSKTSRATRAPGSP